MTPAELRTEILAGPLAAELAPLVAAGDATGVAAALNAKAIRGYVPIEALAAYCCERGITGGVMALLEIPIGGETTAGVLMDVRTKGMLHTVMTLVQLDYRLEWVDVDKPAFVAACDGCIALGVMTGQHKADVLAMAANRQRRAEVAFGSGTSVSHEDVGLALQGD